MWIAGAASTLRHERTLEKSTAGVDLWQAKPPSCKSRARATQMLAKEIER